MEGADQIITLLECRYRDWLSTQEYAACKPQIALLIDQLAEERVNERTAEKDQQIEDLRQTVSGLLERIDDSKDSFVIQAKPIPIECQRLFGHAKQLKVSRERIRLLEAERDASAPSDTP